MHRRAGIAAIWRTATVAVLLGLTVPIHSGTAQQPAPQAGLLAAPTFIFPFGHDWVRAETQIAWNASPSPGATYRLLISRSDSYLGGGCENGDVLVAGPMTATAYYATGLPLGYLCVRLIVTVGAESSFRDASITVVRGDQVGADFGLRLSGDVLFYRPSDGEWCLAYSPGLTGPCGVWSTDWTIKVGDFNGDKLSDLFFYNPTTGRALRGVNTNGRDFAFTEFQWSPGWSISVIDLDGDGRSDVFTYDPVDGRWFRCITTDAGFTYAASGVWSPNWTVYPADFNGDGRADLFLYNATADANHGRWFRVFSNADGSFTYAEGELRWSIDWTITPGDFDGDGRTELILYRANGDWYRVTFTADRAVYRTGRWASGWTLAKGDFNGDRRTDLLLYSRTTGRYFVVSVNTDDEFEYYESPPRHYMATTDADVTVSDIYPDDRSDVLLYNSVTGFFYLYHAVMPGGAAPWDPASAPRGSGWTFIANRVALP